MINGIYKGVKWEIKYAGFWIDGWGEFQPYAGNYLLNLPQEEREKRLKAQIRYRINKMLKEAKE